jgi:hypothetical protein
MHGELLCPYRRLRVQRRRDVLSAKTAPQPAPYDRITGSVDEVKRAPRSRGQSPQRDPRLQGRYQAVALMGGDHACRIHIEHAQTEKARRPIARPPDHCPAWLQDERETIDVLKPGMLEPLPPDVGGVDTEGHCRGCDQRR